MTAILLALLRSKIGLLGLAGVIALAAVWWHGREQYRAGYRAHETEMAASAAKAEKERIADDTHLKNLPADGLCAEYFGARCLQYDGTNKLLRVPVE